jgi:hypothetical protein
VRRRCVLRNWAHRRRAGPLRAGLRRFLIIISRPRTPRKEKGLNDEDEKERRDRQLIELLNELRVALPGVQVPFAFLLIVPFSQQFSTVTPLQRYTYFATLSCTAVSAVLLIAPSSHHHLLWRQHAKEETLVTSNRLTIAGLAFLALAMPGARSS